MDQGFNERLHGSSKLTVDYYMLTVTCHHSQVTSTMYEVKDDSMTALVSENAIDSRPVRSRCACTEVKLV